MGAALCGMVARITAQSPRLAVVRADAEALIEAADALRERFSAAREIDEAAYGGVVRAGSLPKDGDEQRRARTAALQRALIEAAEAPLLVAGMCAEGIALAERAGTLGNTHLASDVECALHFFRASLAASVANVRINHRYIKDAEIVHRQDERLVAIVSIAHETLERLL
jgi:formiminotetrahydrofolate cyclodeaminase